MSSSSLTPPSSAENPASFSGTPAVKPGLSIQSILLIMFMGVALLSTVVVGLIGYVNGNDSLRSAAFDRLTEVRDSRAAAITSLFDGVENSVLLSSRDATTTDAIESFTAGFAELRNSELSQAETAKISGYFSGSFGTRLADAAGKPVDTQNFVPTSPAARYLQLHYTVPFTSVADSAKTEDAGDGSAWSAANARYNDEFARMTARLHYGDVLLLDTKGTVVYSANKGIDLGTNLATGPYSATGLAAAYSKAMSANLLDTVEFTDFGSYIPALGSPTAWAIAPVGGDGTTVGAIAVELPTRAIDDVTTARGNWDSSVLGATGETYLVGSDQTMRSQSRLLAQAPKRYLSEAVGSGTPRAVANRAVADGSTLLLQPVQTDAVHSALDGKTGTIVSSNYLGNETLAAYAPLEIHGLKWVVVSEIGSDEAFGPVVEFTRNLVFSSLAVLVFVALLSLVLAQLIVRPLRRLKVAAGRIAAGEEGVQVDAGRSDELADVGQAFNDMSTSLQARADLLEQQQEENTRLLLALMPESVAKRYRDGEENVVEDHPEVTVLYADIVGFDEYSKQLPSDRALASLNELLHSFHQAADEFGVERVRTTRKGYLASCGLTIPRVDSARRTVEFAVELQQILERFGAQRGVSLSLRAGIDSGTVTSGLVGRTHVLYDLWGDAVDLAFGVQGQTQDAGIFLTQRVADRVPESVKLAPAGTLTTANGDETVWRVEASGAANV